MKAARKLVVFILLGRFYVTKCGSLEGEVLKDFCGRNKRKELKTVN